MGGERVQVIDRSFDLLEALADGPRPLSQICRATGLAKGTAFRLLAGLGARGLVMKDPAAAHYMLGPGLLRLAQSAMLGVGVIPALGHDALRDLAERTGETVALHLQSGVERICVDEVPSDHAIRYSSSIRSSSPLHVGAAGKTLLAFMGDDARAHSLALLATAVDAFDADEVVRSLAPIVRDGYAISDGEYVPGASAISVPVRSRVLLLALSVLGPTPQLPRTKLEGFVPAMRKTAARIAAALDAQMAADQAM